MTGPTALENRLERRVRDWRKQAEAYRAAQLDCEPSEEEWHLNKENADTLERCASELASDLSAGRVFRRSQFTPNEPDLRRLQQLLDENGWTYADLARAVWATQKPA